MSRRSAFAVLLLIGALCSAGAGRAEPSVVAAPAFTPGDTWVFQRDIERGTNNFGSQRLIFRVQQVNSSDMIIGVKLEGSPVDYEDHIVGLDWSQRRVVDGEQVVVGRPFDFPLSVGKTWTITYTDPTHRGLQTSADHRETYRVVGWEDVTTPAGAFHALRIDSDDKIKATLAAGGGVVTGGTATPDGSTVVAHTEKSGPRTVYSESQMSLFYAPSVKYWVKTVENIYNDQNVRVMRKTDSLASFKQG